jgi:DNA end-binding protein Ku
MRSVVWTGHLHFGLVVMPVSLFAAARPETTRFRRIQRTKKIPNAGMAQYLAAGTEYGRCDWSADNGIGELPVGESDARSPSIQYEYAGVRQVLKSEATGEEIQNEDLVKGYEYGPNQFAIIEPSAIERAAVPTSDTIDLFHFVKTEEVDPIYFERSYYMVPEAGGERAYALLLEAMRREGRIGVARIAMHKREHMLLLRPMEKCLVAHTMFYVNEVRRVPEFERYGGALNEREVSTAGALIKGYSGQFEPEKFTDLYQERIRNIIQEEISRTATGETPRAQSSPSVVPDLMESIQLSLAQLESERESSGTPQPKKGPSSQNSVARSKKRKKLA